MPASPSAPGTPPTPGHAGTHRIEVSLSQADRHGGPHVVEVPAGKNRITYFIDAVSKAKGVKDVDQQTANR